MNNFGKLKERNEQKVHNSAHPKSEPDGGQEL
jgi:hypothetical protein